MERPEDGMQESSSMCVLGVDLNAFTCWVIFHCREKVLEVTADMKWVLENLTTLPATVLDSKRDWNLRHELLARSREAMPHSEISDQKAEEDLCTHLHPCQKQINKQTTKNIWWNMPQSQHKWADGEGLAWSSLPEITLNFWSTCQVLGLQTCTASLHSAWVFFFFGC